MENLAVFTSVLNGVGETLQALKKPRPGPQESTGQRSWEYVSRSPQISLPKPTPASSPWLRRDPGDVGRDTHSLLRLSSPVNAPLVSSIVPEISLWPRSLGKTDRQLTTQFSTRSSREVEDRLTPSCHVRLKHRSVFWAPSCDTRGREAAAEPCGEAWLSQLPAGLTRVEQAAPPPHLLPVGRGRGRGREGGLQTSLVCVHPESGHLARY